MHTKTKIIKFACATRLATLIIQFLANVLIPDHDAGVFLQPKSNSTNSFLDETVTVLLGGLVRWDAQYFMHIAKYGYTYENTLAFFPLYPLIVKAIVISVSSVVIFLNEDSILLLTFIVLNTCLFVKAALTLYELGLVVVSKELAYKSSILFCINPATIFFVAPYSECLFSYLTFKGMLNCKVMYDKYSNKSDKRLIFKSIISVIVPIGLSASVRSNGILNIGFIVYFLIRSFVKNLTLKSFADRLAKYIKLCILLLFTTIVCLIPFILVQMYDYYQFCTNFNHTIPDFLVDYGKINNFVLPGMVSKHKQSWCYKKIPLAYSYIQEHYWNVGFLQYFEIKQIPNFILAFPVIFLITTNSVKFFILHKEYCVNLGIFRFKFTNLSKSVKSKNNLCYNREMFVFVVHALFLTSFCFTCIHVQVTTRMICSASPVLYWFAAYYFQHNKEGNHLFSNNFLFNKRNKWGQFIICYFLVYCLIGTTLFSNFLPWT